jgi:His-Xaa-Ser system protein HxsD
VKTELLLDQGLYPTDSILGTAYVFTDRCYVLLDGPSDGKIKVSLTAKNGTSPEAFSTIAGEFQNELLAQALRRHVAERHEKVREIIVARALFGAAPELAPASSPDAAQLGVDPKYVPSSEDDFLEDPLGIALPWEEKYGGPAGAAAALPAPADPDPAPTAPVRVPERT